jgi:hypothetical protein
VRIARTGGFEGRALMAYYAASIHNFLPTFRDNLTVQSSRFMKLDLWILEPLGWDGEDVLKRWQEITTTHCVITHLVRGGIPIACTQC